MRRSLFGGAALAALAVTAVLIGPASAAKPSPQPPNSSCPTSPKNLQAALNVGASYDAGTGIYSVARFGPPGQTSLVKYCVYTDVVPERTRRDGRRRWQRECLDGVQEGQDLLVLAARRGSRRTSRSRSTRRSRFGTATFGQQPTKNDIVLHISDAGQCFNIYGVVTPTCFVTPGEKPGPVCDDGHGNEDAGYNAIPTDVEQMLPAELRLPGELRKRVR